MAMGGLAFKYPQNKDNTFEDARFIRKKVSVASVQEETAMVSGRSSGFPAR